jgi:DNA-directed RNA polymerase specialized sigma subunit
MENKQRHNNSIDTVSILEDDVLVPSVEEEVLGKLSFLELIRDLSDNEEKIIALSLFIGFNKRETASILKVDPSKVILIIRDMRKELAPFWH